MTTIIILILFLATALFYDGWKTRELRDRVKRLESHDDEITLSLEEWLRNQR